jgi:pimeloyl-ACP methyl ester carboxylesterase
MRHFFRYNSGRIHYNDGGNGKVIVLLHGYLETLETWSSFAEKLSRNFRVISVDLPGHGNSDTFAGTHSMEFMANVLNEILKSFNINKVFLTGHSLGGYVTLAFAELFPEKLSGYCLFHSQPFADTEETLKKREREISLALDGKKDLFYTENVRKMFATANLEKFSHSLEQAMKIASSIPGEAIAAILRGMMARPSRALVMEEGRVPCLWILGAMDNYINCSLIQTRIRLPKNAEVAVLKNSGHIGFVEEEKRSVEIITDFIKRRVIFPGT